MFCNLKLSRSRSLTTNSILFCFLKALRHLLSASSRIFCSKFLVFPQSWVQVLQAARTFFLFLGYLPLFLPIRETYLLLMTLHFKLTSSAAIHWNKAKLSRLPIQYSWAFHYSRAKHLMIQFACDFLCLNRLIWLLSFRRLKITVCFPLDYIRFILYTSAIFFFFWRNHMTLGEGIRRTPSWHA